jgi:CRP-like cAMP-binding protein
MRAVRTRRAARRVQSRRKEEMPGLNGNPRNFLLSTLPEEVFERLRPDLEPMTMQAGEVVYQADGCIRHVYFPTDAIVSMMHVMPGGHCTEVAMIGREGMTGVSALLGVEKSIAQVAVQSAGRVLRLPVRQMRAEFARGGELMAVLLRYTQSFIGEMAETAACNRHGTLEQRLCRWLLLSLDRMPGDDLRMTHELIALALGVKREGVTEAAGRLRRAGAIEYRRGRIRVLDRPVLEQTACECYH